MRRRSRTRSISGYELEAPTGEAQSRSSQLNTGRLRSAEGKTRARMIEMDSERIAGILGAIIAVVVLGMAVVFGPNPIRREGQSFG